MPIIKDIYSISMFVLDHIIHTKQWHQVVNDWSISIANVCVLQCKRTFVCMEPFDPLLAMGDCSSPDMLISIWACLWLGGSVEKNSGL